MIFEDDSTIWVILSWMNPGVGWKENGTVIKTMNDNFQKIELFSMKIGDKNSPRIAEITRYSEISSVFHSVNTIVRFRQPSSHTRFNTSSWIGFCKRKKKLIRKGEDWTEEVQRSSLRIQKWTQKLKTVQIVFILFSCSYFCFIHQKFVFFSSVLLCSYICLK